MLLYFVHYAQCRWSCLLDATQTWEENKCYLEAFQAK